MRSDQIKAGIERAPHRSLLRATGLKAEDLGRPFIAVCNAYTDIVPGHVHLARVSAIIKEEIRKAGGTPFEFNTIGVCDGIAMGHSGMKYSLASRELIADSVETMLTAHRFDGVLCIPNCDKIVPGMIMGALRCDLPTVLASGGPMAAGRRSDGTPLDLISVFEGIGQCNAGQLTATELADLECQACPGPGSCSGMFTANSMNCLAEGLGLALPGNGTILATDPRREQLWRAAARRIVTMTREGPTIRQMALITDGRFSGGTRGACIGHVSPEAAEGGTIAFVRDGDIIEIDLPNRKLAVKLSAAQLSQRRKNWRPAAPKIQHGWLQRYAQLATSASTGAVLAGVASRAKAT
ncbi:MAG: dihydroxy-acid dehydratase [Verrucomicrobiota bacterium]